MATTLADLEARVVALETELRQIKDKPTTPESEAALPTTKQAWWERRFGAFRDDPIYDEAMRLGREWRESQRPPEEPEQ